MYTLIIQNTTWMPHVKFSSDSLVTVVQLWLLQYTSCFCTAFLKHHAT